MINFDTSKIYFMLDLETTGVNYHNLGLKKDEIMEVGIAALQFDGKYFKVLKTFNQLIPVNQEPVSDFAQKYQIDLYKRSKSSPLISKEELRDKILDFCTDFGVTLGKIKFMGLNVGVFDLNFLTSSQILKPSAQVDEKKNVTVQDYDYHCFELNTLIEISMLTLGLDPKKRSSYVKEMVEKDKTIDLPAGGDHTADYDCIKQAKFLNQWIKEFIWKE